MSPAFQRGNAMKLQGRQFMHLAAGAAALPAVRVRHTANAQSLPRILSAGLRFNYLLRLLSHDDVDLLPAHELDHRSPLVDP